MDADLLGGLRAVIVTHRGAGHSVLETLEGRAGEALEELEGAARGIVVVATCNRFEIYLDDPSGGGAALASSWLGERAGIKPRVLEGRRAAWHLFRVAAGLESAILGDHEVVVQVRDSWLRSKELGLTTPLLDEVFHRAVAAGRRVRRETGLGEGAVGYPSAAVQLAARLLGGLDERNILIVGAGQAARGMLRSLCSKWTPGSVAVANRTPSRAVEALREAKCEGEVLNLTEAPKAALRADAVLAAVSMGGARLFKRELVETSPAVFVDISVPPVTDHVPGRVYLSGDVEEEARRSLEQRMRWIPKAEEILAEEMEALLRKLATRPVDEAMNAIMRFAEAIMDRELNRAIRNMERGVPPDEALRVALNSFSKKFARQLRIALIEAARRDASIVELVRRSYEEALH